MFSFLRVLRRRFPCSLRQTEHLRSNTDAAFVQGLDRNFVAFPDFAKHVSLRHTHVFHQQFARARSTDAELVLFLTDGESGKFLFDDEGGNAAITGRGIHVGEKNKDAGLFAVSDPKLSAVDDVFGAAQFGARLHRECV